MEKTVKSCSECLFANFSPLWRYYTCSHPKSKFPDISIKKYVVEKRMNIHCPEKGVFIIKTQKIEDETTTI